MKIDVFARTTVDINSLTMFLPYEACSNLPDGLGSKSEGYDDIGYLEITVNPFTGQIKDYGKDLGAVDAEIVVTNKGTYILNDANDNAVLSTYGVAPSELIPGWADHLIILEIDKTGLITNWPKEPNFDYFWLINNS